MMSKGRPQAKMRCWPDESEIRCVCDKSLGYDVKVSFFSKRTRIESVKKMKMKTKTVKMRKMQKMKDVRSES